jgi:hypothetical protein
MADQDVDEPEEEASEPIEGDDAGTTGWSTWVRRNFSAESRLRAASERRAAAASAGIEPGASAQARSEATKAAVNTLDKRERRLGIFATVAELALTALVVIPYLTHSHKPSSSELKTMSAVHVFLIEGVVLGAFLLLGTLVKRRALLGFASLIVGAWLLEIKALFLLGIAYLGFGLWLVMRALKYTNREGRRAPREPRAPRAAKASKASVGAGKAVANRSAPQPNKRYTPPKPSRPVPKKPAPARADPPKR